MLDISFLPVESSDEEESILLSAGESEDETRSARSEYVAEDIDPADLEERTMRWVNQESESPLVQNFDVEEAMGTDHNIYDRKECSDQLQTKENSSRNLPQSEAWLWHRYTYTSSDWHSNWHRHPRSSSWYSVCQNKGW